MFKGRRAEEPIGDPETLEELYQTIRDAERWRHLRQPGIRLVPGTGAERPMAMVVGEAPGAQENIAGEPFVGPSGRVLHQLMELAGLRSKPGLGLRFRSPTDAVGEEVPQNVWLTNTVKYRPPGNRTPQLLEQLDARAELLAEWRLVGSPPLIIAVGSVAAGALNLHAVIPQRGALFETRKPGVWVCYQYHPAFGLRGGDARKEMMERHWEQLGEEIRTLVREGELKW